MLYEEDFQINNTAPKIPTVEPSLSKDSINDVETPTPTFEVNEEFDLPISVAVAILVLYMLIGASQMHLLYKAREKWTFFESFYFVFISMSTIGLGDLVPDNPDRLFACMLFFIFGLAFTSMCINVVQVKLHNTFEQASAKLVASMGIQVFEDSLVTDPPVQSETVQVHKPKINTRDEEKDDIESK
jgi:potassium channel subfamily K member 18